MTLHPWKVLSSTHLRDHIRIDRCELPGGQVIEGMVLEFGTWVTVLALTRTHQAVLVHQYRHGAGRVILELPGGAADSAEESPLAVARRELQEETGYTSSRFIEIGRVSPNPANQNNLIHSFLALDAVKSGDQHLDATEEIEVVLVPFEELIAMAKRGELLQSMQVATLFFALAHLDRIR